MSWKDRAVHWGGIKLASDKAMTLDCCPGAMTLVSYEGECIGHKDF